MNVSFYKGNLIQLLKKKNSACAIEKEFSSGSFLLLLFCECVHDEQKQARNCQ